MSAQPAQDAANDPAALLAEAREAFRIKRNADAELARLRKYKGETAGMKADRARHQDRSAEAAATLALRDGDPSAIAFYADRGRIHVGDLGACADQAYAAWAADRADGTDSVLIAPTRDLVAELNTRARNDRIAGQPENEIGSVLTLADGTKVSAGDRIITRENDRRLRISRTTRGTSVTVMATITFSRLALVSAIRAMASSTPGIDISPSMMRMMMPSSQRTKPVTRPMARPISVASTATDRPTVSDTRAPYTTRLYTSRPSMSVPNQ